MAEFKKEMGFASAVAVLAAVGIAVLAISAFPSRGTGNISSTQSEVTRIGKITATTSGVTSTVTQTQLAVTTTTSGGVRDTITRTQLACPGNGGAVTQGCLYLDGWGVNYTGKTARLILGYPGSGSTLPATMNITFTGSQANHGFEGSVVMTSVTLPASKWEQIITSPTLPNLQNGDQLTVSVTGTAGMNFSATFTFTI